MRVLSAVALLFLAGITNAEEEAKPLVHIQSGALSGRLQGGINVFQGIPFAAPPVGILRWREPQPVVNWSGIRDATHAASPCSQPVDGIDTFLAPLADQYHAAFERKSLKPSEDCLYLNVFSPSGAKALPVMVWLHGGSNRVGTGADESYDGSSLALHGVIVVTINYRLGVIGFLAHPDLTAESPHHSSGNYGLLDQIAALKWVQQNINQFGGDPNNITLFGESAGSVDATTLIASPLVTGLFRRVIAESGPAFGLGPPVTLAQAQIVGAAVGQAAVAESSTPARALEVLRRMPPDQVAALEARVIASHYKGFDPNASVVDGWLLPKPAAQAYASGSIQKVDLLAGLNGRELSAFRIGAAAAQKKAGTPPAKGAPADAVKRLANVAHPLYGAWTDIAVATYLVQILMHGDVAVDRASNDMLVACPVGAEAVLTQAIGERAFVYRFDRSIPGIGESTLGAFHGLEVPYVFNAFTVRSWRWLPFTSIDQNLSATIETYWTNFAKYGNPNASNLPKWKAWNSDDEPYLEFSQSGQPIPQTSFSPSFCHLSPKQLRQALGGNIAR